MVLIALPLGLLLPTLTGWLVIRLLEWNTPVLYRWERWVCGMVIGIVLSMFSVFLLHTIGIIPLSMMGFLIGEALLTGILGALFYRHKALVGGSTSLPPLEWQQIRRRRWLTVIVALLTACLVLKVLGGMAFLSAPAYFDDALNNWNLRGKVMHVQDKILIEIEEGKGAGTSSYPPAVPMLKASFASIGGWSESVVNMIHLVWYLAAIVLVFFSIVRLLPLPWALLAAYALSSIPLFLRHGTIPYADAFLAVHIFFAVSMLFHGVREHDAKKRLSFLKLGALGAGLLVFTKNEALLMHLPPLGVLLIASLVWLRSEKKMSLREAHSIILWYAGFIAAFLLPWLTFKWAHGLSFGNAKAISGLTLEYHEGVITSILYNTFMEGNWIFLFPLFVGLLIACRKIAFRSPLVLLNAFFLIIWCGQLPIYIFTELSTEAILQTGYARGLIHLTPIVVMSCTVMAHALLSRKDP